MKGRGKEGETWNQGHWMHSSTPQPSSPESKQPWCKSWRKEVRNRAQHSPHSFLSLDLFLLPGGKRRRGCDYQLYRGVGRGSASRFLTAAGPGPDHPGETLCPGKLALPAPTTPKQVGGPVNGVTPDLLKKQGPTCSLEHQLFCIGISS